MTARRLDQDPATGKHHRPPTAEMLSAGAEAILCSLGGADLGGHFSAQALAAEVFQAMDRARSPAQPAARARAA